MISWGLDSGFTAEFDWVGTRDPTPFLAAPEGLAVLDEFGDAGRAWNHGLAVRASRELPARWGTRFEAGEASIGSMVTLPLPDRLGDSRESAAAVRDRLFFEHHIEVQVHADTGGCGCASAPRSTTTGRTSNAWGTQSLRMTPEVFATKNVS